MAGRADRTLRNLLAIACLFVAAYLCASLSLPLIDAWVLNPSRPNNQLVGERFIHRDANGVVQFDYGEQSVGVQYHPVQISQHINRDIIPRFDKGEAGAKEELEAHAAKLKELTILNNGLAHVEYRYPVIGWTMPVPWHGALADADGLLALYRCRTRGVIHGTERLEAGLLKSFQTEIEEGGLIRITADGAWLEEYASPGAEHGWVLNGHIFAANAIYEYSHESGSHVAKRIADRAVAALVDKGPEFSDRYVPRYDLISGHPNSNRYLRITIIELDRMIAWSRRKSDLQLLRSRWYPNLWTRMLAWPGKTGLLYIGWTAGWVGLFLALAWLARRVKWRPVRSAA